MELTCHIAETELERAGKLNPGNWTEHSRFVALACKNIAAQCGDLSPDRAYCFGLLHDIGRYAGVTSEKHLIDGYRFCMERGWEKAAQICISHAFMIQDIKTSIGTFDVSDEEYLFMERFIKNAVYDDYDRLVQLCDALALPAGFCLLEKRFVDVALRYGTPPVIVERWKKTLEIKDFFEQKINGSIYRLLPGVVENTFNFYNTEISRRHEPHRMVRLNQHIERGTRCGGVSLFLYFCKAVLVPKRNRNGLFCWPGETKSARQKRISYGMGSDFGGWKCSYIRLGWIPSLFWYLPWYRSKSPSMV